MRGVRTALSPEERERLADSVAERVVAVPEVRAARTVLLFSSFGSEIPTTGLVARLVAEGKRVLLPFVEGDSMVAAEFLPDQDGALVETTYGPKEPASRNPVHPRQVDVVILPGLAFDRNGHRLGYGGGYYDRYVRGLRAVALRVGIGFARQVVDDVPQGPGDERVDLVVTDRETIRCPPRG
jgi:5-formyltetrahydrofolate cyclo-ligase